MGLLYIVIGIATVVATGLALTGKGRYLIKGVTNLLFIDIAKTPKGAEAIYTQAIEEAQGAYNKASNNFQKIAGLLETAKSNFANTNSKVERTKAKMEELAKKQMFKEVDIFAQELSNLEDDLKMYTDEVNKYNPMYHQAEMLTQQYETKLMKLKKDKKTVIRQLEINQQTKEMYDDLDELKNVKSSEKLLEAVKEGVVETGEVATGAKVLHNNKHSTKLLEAESAVKTIKVNDYAEQLRKKYEKNSR